MGLPRVTPADRAPLLARHGYLFTAALAERERRELHERGAVTLTFLGRPTLLVSGVSGVELFYDEDRVVRHRAVPAPIAMSLFGPGAVHGLDGQVHRHRKQLFLAALRQDEVDRVVEIARRRWRAEVARWGHDGTGSVFASAVTAFGSSIIEWAGADEDDATMARHAGWMADIVGGFGVPGPAYLKAVVARRRCDRWARGLVRRARSRGPDGQGPWLEQVAGFRDADGQQLPEATAAVELLNILRPTVAVAWLTAFAVLALDQHPSWRARLRDDGDGTVAEAFAHEVRRYYPFVPVLAARARHGFEHAGEVVAPGQRVLLDVHGTDHDVSWPDPWAFDPGRFLGVDPCEVAHYVPQGGGPRETGHRCPGEGVSNGLLQLVVSELAQLDGWRLPMQDLHYSLRRMPTRPASGVRVEL